MDSSRTTELKVGIISFVGIALLVIGLMWGKQRSIGAGEYMITLHFPSSSGLMDGDPVSVNGVTKGRVKDLTIDNTGVLVHAMIEPDVQLHVDASARIMMLELMSGKKIEIQPGQSVAALDKSSILQGTTAWDIPSAIASLGMLSADINSVIFRLDTLLATANNVMSDSQMIHSIRLSILDLGATIAMAKSFIADNRADMKTTLMNVKDLVLDIKDFTEKNRPAIEHALTSADKTLTDADGAITRADSTLASVNRMLNELKTNNSAAGKLLYDKEFALRLDSTITDADKLFQFILSNGININVRLGSRP